MTDPMTPEPEITPAETPAEPVTPEPEHSEPEPEPAEPEPETEPDAAADGDTFPREYVTELRNEAAEHRRHATEQADRAESLARALWAERVAGLHLLADPADLPYDSDKLTDPAAIRAAAEQLLTERPHLRTRKITGPAWQAETQPDAGVSLAGLLRSHS